MVSVSAAVRSRVCSLRSRPSIRTRGGEPTLQCRSEPPHSTSARKNGSIVRVEVTRECSAVPQPVLTHPAGSLRRTAQLGGGLADDGYDIALLDDVALVDLEL